MSDRVFYVGSLNKRQLTGYVPAKFLTINGRPVVDPTPGGSQRAYIYADGSDKYKTRGEIGNPNNYLIVPANYAEQQARDFAAQVAVTLKTKGARQAQAQMSDAFSQGGSQDVQRHPQWGIPEGSVVPAFVSSASYHLGSVTRQAGIPRAWSEIGGGLANLQNRYIKQPWNYLWEGKWDQIHTDGPAGLSRNNYDNLSKGFADADAPRKVPSPVNDFGYNPQAQYPPSQIGDGSGLGVGDWRFAFAGVDPSNPFLPVPSLQTDSKPPPKLVRVDRNTPPTLLASTIARSGRESPFDNRFSNWTSVSEGTFPRNPNLPVPPAEAGVPRGIFTGRPMPLWTTPPPLGGLLDHSDSSGKGSWSGGSGGMADNQKSSGGIGVGGPVTLSDNRSPPSDVAEWVATLAGVDPRNPERLLPWLLQGRR